MTITLKTEAPSISESINPWLEAMLQVARHYRLETSVERVRVMANGQAGCLANVHLKEMAYDMGLSLSFEKLHKGILDPWHLPVVVEFDNDQIGVIETIDNGQFAGVRLSGEHGVLQALPVAEVCARARRVLLLRPEVSVSDARIDGYIKPYETNWFWKLALHDWRRYSDVMLASLIANLLALASMLFSMQIYDRVIPAQSEPTLWVLFTGVVIAIVFEFCMRLSRTHITDKIGKRADLRISDRVFGHALRIRTQAQSKSTGSLISQIRELEQVRELITSTTVNTLADLPFFFLFLGVLWYLGGAMALVPLAILPLLLIPGLLVQPWLAKHSKEGMREASMRNAILIEAVQGNEDIKLLRAEQRFQNQWNHINQVLADISMRQRFVIGVLTTWTQELQSLVYVMVILVGCFKVISGDLTTGALIGSSILSSRMIAPLAQLAGVMSRWQQAKVARQGLDELMKRPVDQPLHSKMLHRPVLRGDYRLEGVQFRYEQDQKQPSLHISGLSIKAGEKVAVLGRNGAGKSTLLQMLSGLQLPQEGNVQLDSLNLSMIDPYDVRRDVGFLSQQASLFFGTLRDNITMGKPMASDDDIIHALKLCGALTLVQSLPDGLDHMIREGGKGLSGGQRQILLLARTFIRNPRVVLLDEPTAWLDEFSEQQLIDNLLPWLEGRTLVVATHRPAVLKWADRIIVLDNGRVVLDDTKQIVLSQISKPRATVT